MLVNIRIKSTGELIVAVNDEEPRKAIKVRGHFRVVNGKKVYVKTYRRKR